MVRLLVAALLSFLTFQSLTFAQTEEIPSFDNSQAIRKLTLFATELTNSSKEISFKEYRQIVNSILPHLSSDFASSTKIESLLLQAYENRTDKATVNEKITEAIQIYRQSYVTQNSHIAAAVMAANVSNPYWLQNSPPGVTASNVMFPPYLGFNQKDPLEFCYVWDNANDVINTNYKDLNLQLFKRFPNASLDEIAEIIIHQRALDTLALAAASSTASYAASVAAMKASVVNESGQLIVKSGKYPAVALVASAAITMMYFDICYYAKQNARMIYQLVDLYDTGTFYTIDEKQIYSSIVLFAAMGGKMYEKYLLERTTSNNLGSLTKDAFYNIRNRTGQALQFFFENGAFGIKKGIDAATGTTPPVVPPPSPTTPPTPGVPDPSVPLPPQVNPGGTSGPFKPAPGNPTFPPMPPTPPPPGTGGPYIPQPPGAPVDVEIAKVSPWALAAIPANAAVTYASMQGVGRAALAYMHAQVNDVYQLPMSLEYQQDAVLKLLILAGINSQPAPAVAPVIPTSTVPTVPTDAGTSVSASQSFPMPPFPPTIPGGPMNPGTPPAVPTPTPVQPPTQLTLRDPNQRQYILKLFEKHNPSGNPTRLAALIADMDNFNFTAANNSFQQVFSNELLENIPAKMMIIKSVIELLYLDGNISATDFTIIDNVRVQVMGFADKMYANNVLRLKYLVKAEMNKKVKGSAQP